MRAELRFTRMTPSVWKRCSSHNLLEQVGRKYNYASSKVRTRTRGMCITGPSYANNNKNLLSGIRAEWYMKWRSHHTVPEDSTSILKGEIDRFGGVRIDIEHHLRENVSLASSADLKRALHGTISQCRDDGRTTIWLEIPAHCGQVIPVAADLGFVFHHAEGYRVMMYQWLRDGETKVPDYATHQIGVSGFVLDEESEKVLMVQDKHRLARWKFPGGYSKLSEDFDQTAVREVFEETGIKTEFCSILAFRQQHLMPYSFDRSDIYVVCRLKPLTFHLNICSDELVDARWINLKELLTMEVHTHLTREVAKLAQSGLRRGFDKVDIKMRELESVYKGRTYKLFTRPCIPTE